MKPSVETRYYTGSNSKSDADGSTSVPSSTLISRQIDFNTVVTNVSSKPYKTKMSYHTFRKLSIFNGISVTESLGTYRGADALTRITNAARIGNMALGTMYSNARVLDAEWVQPEMRSLQKIYDQIRNSDSNLSVDLAEGGQTVRMIKDTLNFKKFLAKFITKTVKSRGYKKIGKSPKQAQRRARYVANKWLEVQYGWKPFLSSIYGVAETMRKARVAGVTMLKARAANHKNEDFRGGLGTFLSHRSSVHVTGSYRIERGALYRSPQPSFTDFFSLNPLGIAWELVPFSFVADWFVGVGQCLDNWETYYRYRSNYVNGYITYTTLEDRFGDETGLNQYIQFYWPSGARKDGTGGYDRYENIGRCTYRYKERNPVSQLPLPYGPQVKLGLSGKHMLDLAALITQQVRRIR